MKHSANAVMMPTVDFQRILKRLMAARITRVNDQIKSSLGGELEVTFKKISLAPAKIFIGPPFRCRMVVIETGLTDRTNPWFGDQCGKLLRCIVWRVMHVAGMNANAGMDCRVRRNFDIRRHIIKACRERDHAVDAGGERTLNQDRHFLFGKAMRCEMAM